MQQQLRQRSALRSLYVLHIMHCCAVCIFYLFAAALHLSLAQSASPAGFVSIDCGRSTSAGNYTDSSGIEWAPDGAIWPALGDGWSATATVTPPNIDLGADAQKYTTLRYFPAGQMNQSKFCYELPATSGSYYLVRATFWMGTQAFYATRTTGLVSFAAIIDTYVDAVINITLPQTSPWIEEVYVRAMAGVSSVAFCLSAESDSSDAPFINSLELRPLLSTMTSVDMINQTNNAMRTFARYDLGASADAAPTLRYPNDTLDRTWIATTSTSRNETTEDVIVQGMSDLPPMAVLQTTAVATTAADSFLNFTLIPGTNFRYYMAMWFAELDTRVNASGQRVFDIFLQGARVVTALDVFKLTGRSFAGYEIYSLPSLSGPYSDNILINFTATADSVYLPSIAAIEILQLLSDTMAAPTFASDVLAIRELSSSFSNLSSFAGDPCFPSGYGYPWVNCSGNRVTSISLSNYDSAPGKTIPTTLNNLHSLTHILLSGNALEGPLPDFGNLTNLQVLDLSNNKLNGSIPDSLAYLPYLTYIDLQNNNFSGMIPTALQEKQGLTLKYGGNNFLCLTSNATCSSSTSSTNNNTILSSSGNKNNTPLIIGVVVGLVAFFILVSIVIFFVMFKKQRVLSNPLQQDINTTSTSKYEDDPHVVSQTQVIEVANVARAFKFQEIILAANNFSQILGKGGFGYVYKGTLESGLDVALKVLSDASQQGEQEFLNEVSLLSRVHHKKLVGLIGYCIEKKLVLVYEYMPNGSLFDALFGNVRSIPLKWIERLQILLDAAQGLAYLHHGCSSLIIHRDVKSSNILLSKNLEGKMSDFGISRLTANNGDALTTRILGSKGYLDPQYASTLRFSEKVDVYSFGVVIFETICGQPPLIKDSHKGVGEIHIMDWVRPSYEQGAIEEIVDHNLGRYNIASIWKVVEVAMACVQFDEKERPTMNEVCSELLEALRLESNSHAYALSPTNTVGLLSSSTLEVKAR